MLKQRTVAVAKYLNRERMASFKEIASALGESERAIRYDIEQINAELKLKKAAQIEKYPKGMLFLPDDLDITIVLDSSELVLAPQERLAVLRLYALFDIKKLNIRALCDKMEVSRRTIQNDIAVVQTALGKFNMMLSYEKGFQLQEPEELGFELRSNELKKHVPLLCMKDNPTVFGGFVRQTLMDVPLPLDEVLGWLGKIIETLGWSLSDDSFCWYVANVLTFTWYIVTEKAVPHKFYEENSEIANFIPQYEEIIGRKLTHEERGILSGFSKYTSRYVYFDLNADLMSVEDITKLLIREMGRELHKDFSQDGILRKGLLNHISSMLKRVRDSMQLQDDVTGLLPEEYGYVLSAMQDILQKHGELYVLSKNEMIYLVMYFLGSMRRLQEADFKSVLLICGYGYGTTVILKDALRNEYQVIVKKSVSAHQLRKFDAWEEVDAVISTVNVDLPVKRPFAQVNVVFNKEDYAKLDMLGLRRRHVLTNYLAIERKLDFLSAEDRQRVLDIIREELGYKDVRASQKYSTLSDLLPQGHILCVDHLDDWHEAVRLSTGILEKSGKIEPAYHDSIIRGMEAQGFYSVTDGIFALLHGREGEGVRESCMSLLISKEPIQFGEKRVNIVFCLASRDKKEHIPAVIGLMRMVSMTKFIELLRVCRDSDMAAMVIETCENYMKMQCGQIEGG